MCAQFTSWNVENFLFFKCHLEILGDFLVFSPGHLNVNVGDKSTTFSLGKGCYVRSKGYFVAGYRAGSMLDIK